MILLQTAWPVIFMSHLLSSATHWLLHMLLFSPTEWLQLSSTHPTEWRQCVNYTISCILLTWSEQLFQECTSSPGLENVCPWDSQNEGVAIVNSSDCASFPWTETTKIFTDSLPTVVLVLICDCLHIPAVCEGHMRFSMALHTLL